MCAVLHQSAAVHITDLSDLSTGHFVVITGQVVPGVLFVLTNQLALGGC